jgi:hypothetical protein
MASSMNRRALIVRTLLACPAYALLGALRVDAADSRLDAQRWLMWHNEIARALSRGEITPALWQAEVEALAAQVDPAQVIAETKSATLRNSGRGGENDPVRYNITFHDEHGAPRRLSYGAALFVFDTENVITPHAHRNMVSAHMIVEGEFRVRNFDRVRDEDGAVVIRPTRDAVMRLGEVSTMSTAHDNVHWFVPRAARATTFDVIVSGLGGARPSYVIEPVDPVRGQKLPDGTIRAPYLTFAESTRFYTRAV